MRRSSSVFLGLSCRDLAKVNIEKVFVLINSFSVFFKQCPTYLICLLRFRFVYKSHCWLPSLCALYSGWHGSSLSRNFSDSSLVLELNMFMQPYTWRNNSLTLVRLAFFRVCLVLVVYRFKPFELFWTPFDTVSFICSTVKRCNVKESWNGHLTLSNVA